jgi:hypothetical protein
MDLNEEWKQEFTSVFPDVKFIQEAGYAYAYIPEYMLPEGCTPTKSALLLCVSPKDGYDSRLYFPQPVVGPENRNWNSNVYLLDRTWHSISWRTQAGLSYMEMLMVNLRAFKP